MVTDSRKAFTSLLDEKREEIQARMFNEYGNEISTIKCHSVYLVHREIITNEMPRQLYVGKTKQTSGDRFRQHMAEIKRRLEGKAAWDKKYRWMYGVISAGYDLNVITLNVVPKFVVYDIELEWVFYLANNGFLLLNDNNNYYTNRGYR